MLLTSLCHPQHSCQVWLTFGRRSAKLAPRCATVNSLPTLSNLVSLASLASLVGPRSSNLAPPLLFKSTPSPPWPASVNSLSLRVSPCLSVSSSSLRVSLLGVAPCLSVSVSVSVSPLSLPPFKKKFSQLYKNLTSLINPQIIEFSKILFISQMIFFLPFF